MITSENSAMQLCRSKLRYVIMMNNSQIVSIVLGIFFGHLALYESSRILEIIKRYGST